MPYRCICTSSCIHSCGHMACHCDLQMCLYGCLCLHLHLNKFLPCALQYEHRHTRWNDLAMLGFTIEASNLKGQKTMKSSMQFNIYVIST
jgi:hypothetical protein